MSAIDPSEMRDVLANAKHRANRFSGNASAAYWTEDPDLQNFLIRELLSDFEFLSQSIEQIKANFDDLEAAE